MAHLLRARATRAESAARSKVLSRLLLFGQVSRLVGQRYAYDSPDYPVPRASGDDGSAVPRPTESATVVGTSSNPSFDRI